MFPLFLVSALTFAFVNEVRYMVPIHMIIQFIVVSFFALYGNNLQSLRITNILGGNINRVISAIFIIGLCGGYPHRHCCGVGHSTSFHCNRSLPSCKTTTLFFSCGPIHKPHNLHLIFAD